LLWFKTPSDWYVIDWDETIFPNSQITMIDQNTYTRTLPDGSNIIETLFGKPEIK